jgi:hypothetical protein
MASFCLAIPQIKNNRISRSHQPDGPAVMGDLIPFVEGTTGD